VKKERQSSLHFSLLLFHLIASSPQIYLADLKEPGRENQREKERNGWDGASMDEKKTGERSCKKTRKNLEKNPKLLSLSLSFFQLSKGCVFSFLSSSRLSFTHQGWWGGER
jgi:hypothetical protein